MITETLLLNLTSEGSADCHYRVDVGECNDGTPWVGKVSSNHVAESDWDSLADDVARMHDIDLVDAEDWLLALVCIRVGLPKHVVCIVCRDPVKTSGVRTCPYSDRNLCPSCYRDVESQTPCISQGIIRSALEEVQR